MGAAESQRKGDNGNQFISSETEGTDEKLEKFHARIAITAAGTNFISELLLQPRTSSFSLQCDELQ